MRPRKNKFYFCVFMLLSLFISMEQQACAQNEPPVQINMDVLNAISPAAGLKHHYQAPLQKHRRASLTGPSRTSRSQKPVRAKPLPPKRIPVSFPVEIKNRTESYDPSLERSALYTDTAEAPVKQKAPVSRALLPDFTPIKTIRKRAKTVQKSQTEQKSKIKIPFPSHRPALHKTPAVFIKQARKEVLPHLRKKTISMPAVPPQRVQAEYLAPTPQANTKKIAAKDALNDILEKQLVIPDKKAMVKSVKAISVLANALAPSFSPLRQKTTVLPSAPLPTHKPTDIDTKTTKAKSVIANRGRTFDVTAIEPAAGIELASLVDITAKNSSKPHENRVPRTPPENNLEKDYISLSFAPGIATLDEKIKMSLNEKIIPLLKDNPQWRLQIQAFAGKTENNLKNARRTSLSRALSVRSHLLGQGIEARRMDVRALGMKTDRTPVDRVDFILFDPNARN